MSLYLFDFSETIPKNYLGAVPKYFVVKRTSTFDVILIRLLTSTANITHKRTNKTVALENNFTNFPYNKVARKSGKQLKTFISPFKLEDYIKYSRKFYGRNISFYNNLLQELTFYFYYSSQKQHQSAFVNLYRYLEFMSFSFPMVHSSHFNNIIGSFDALKRYFGEDIKTSEIKFFERFVRSLFDGMPHLSLTTTFEFSNADPIISNNCFDAFFSLIKNTEWTTADRANHVLTTENSNIIPLFKAARNKYFHFAVGGQRNIQNIDLKDPDFFFEKINNQFLNWIAFIQTETIKEILENTLL